MPVETGGDGTHADMPLLVSASYSSSECVSRSVETVTALTQDVRASPPIVSSPDQCENQGHLLGWFDRSLPIRFNSFQSSSALRVLRSSLKSNQAVAQTALDKDTELISKRLIFAKNSYSDDGRLSLGAIN